MAIDHGVPADSGWLTRLLTTDFCPWANRFVYWLKEPIGWFVLALVVSLIVGLYVSPIGWTLAASLAAIMVVGMGWPWVAIRVTSCQLHCEVDCVHEDEVCRMIVSVSNRVPVPLWGLAIEGYLDCDADQSIPTVGLACVPPLCTSDFGIAVRPPLRGHYPIQTPHYTCSFPFGLWTARRTLTATHSLTVWPKVFRIAGICPFVGQASAYQGEGQLGGRSGDFVGVRSYRRGDSAKHINWVASARTDSLIVTERGGPQRVELDVFVNVAKQGTREQLADRIRVAASVLLNLHHSDVSTQLRIGSRSLPIFPGAQGRRQILDALADVPLDGGDSLNACAVDSKSSRRASIEITSDAAGHCVVNIADPAGGRRAGGKTVRKTLPSDSALIERIEGFWSEVGDADVAA